MKIHPICYVGILEAQNLSKTQSHNSILVSIDVESLYPSIPVRERMETFQEYISDSKFRDQSLPWQFLMLLLGFVLNFNTFIFNSKIYIQQFGTAIGTKLAPVFANLFMGRLEKNILRDWKGRPPEMWKSYIDDIFTIWNDSESELLKFLTYINTYHRTIKFTAEYRTLTHQVKTNWSKVDKKLIVKRYPLLNLKPRSVDFLDTTISINSQGKFVTDLFVKSTDRVTYLLPQSCHPGHISANIPYSLAYRLKRIVSCPDTFLIRLDELKKNLLTRNYSVKVIDQAFNKLSNISRKDALKKVPNKIDNRVTLALTYDPRIKKPNLILKKHFEIASNDPDFKKNFPVIPKIGYRRSRNLGELLIRAKLYDVDVNYVTRNRNGFKRCLKKDSGCNMCLHSYNTKFHISCHSKKKYEIKSVINCDDTYVIYSIQCKKCPNIQYIGQTTQPVFHRFNAHKNDVDNNRGWFGDREITKPIPLHFCSRNHKVSDMIFIPFEKLRKKDKTLLDLREKFWIKEKKTALYGLNRVI